MNTTDIQDLGSLLHVKIPDSKTSKVRSFTILGDVYLTLYRKYASLRPSSLNEMRFLLKYQNGVCYKQVMGIHKIGSAAKEVASFLNLPNWSEYTGHCLRRTSATLLVDGGADVTCLKRHGGWKSSSVAEGYIEDSIRNKKDIAKLILSPNSDSVECGESSQESQVENICGSSKMVGDSGAVSAAVAASAISFQGAKISNCTFNLHFNNK